MIFIKSADETILNVLKHNERYQGKSIISAHDLLDMCIKRFYLMQEILAPVVLYLQEKIDIKSISFQSDILDNALAIYIEYLSNGTKKFVTFGYPDSIMGPQIIGSVSDFDSKILYDNPNVFSAAFDEGLDNHFDKESEIYSTSGLFTFNQQNDKLSMSCNNLNAMKDYFELSITYTDDMLDILNNILCKTSFASVNELLKDIENLKVFLEHIKIYEKDVPRYLIKK